MHLSLLMPDGGAFNRGRPQFQNKGFPCNQRLTDGNQSSQPRRSIDKCRLPRCSLQAYGCLQPPHRTGDARQRRSLALTRSCCCWRRPEQADLFLDLVGLRVLHSKPATPKAICILVLLTLFLPLLLVIFPLLGFLVFLSCFLTFLVLSCLFPFLFFFLC